VRGEERKRLVSEHVELTPARMSTGTGWHRHGLAPACVMDCRLLADGGCGISAASVIT